MSKRKSSQSEVSSGVGDEASNLDVRLVVEDLNDEKVVQEVMGSMMEILDVEKHVDHLLDPGEPKTKKLEEKSEQTETDLLPDLLPDLTEDELISDQVALYKPEVHGQPVRPHADGTKIKMVKGVRYNKQKFPTQAWKIYKLQYQKWKDSGLCKKRASRAEMAQRRKNVLIKKIEEETKLCSIDPVSCDEAGSSGSFSTNICSPLISDEAVPKSTDNIESSERSGSDYEEGDDDDFAILPDSLAEAMDNELISFGQEASTSSRFSSFYKDLDSAFQTEFCGNPNDEDFNQNAKLAPSIEMVEIPTQKISSCQHDASTALIEMTTTPNSNITTQEISKKSEYPRFNNPFQFKNLNDVQQDSGTCGTECSNLSKSPGNAASDRMLMDMQKWFTALVHDKSKQGKSLSDTWDQLKSTLEAPPTLKEFIERTIPKERTQQVSHQREWEDFCEERSRKCPKKPHTEPCSISEIDGCVDGKYVFNIQTFHPSLEMLEDTVKFTMFLKSQGAHEAGITKFTTPPGFLPNASGYNEDVLDKLFHSKISKWQIVYQEVTRLGSQILTNEMECEPYKIQTLYDMSNSRRFKRPSSDVKEIERIFWEELPTFKNPYMKDIQGTLFDVDWKYFNLDKLQSHLTEKFSWNRKKGGGRGLVASYLYAGVFGSVACWHTEDSNLYSVNFLHFGDPRIWYSMPLRYTTKFMAVLQGFKCKLFSKDNCCEFVIMHKQFLLFNSELESLGVPYNMVVQHPGEYIMTFPAGFHAVFSTGFSVSEASNMAIGDGWKYNAITYPQCPFANNNLCEFGGSEGINLGAYLKNSLTPKEFLAWKNDALLLRHPFDVDYLPKRFYGENLVSEIPPYYCSPELETLEQSRLIRKIFMNEKEKDFLQSLDVAKHITEMLLSLGLKKPDLKTKPTRRFESKVIAEAMTQEKHDKKDKSKIEELLLYEDVA